MENLGQVSKDIGHIIKRAQMIDPLWENEYESNDTMTPRYPNKHIKTDQLRRLAAKLTAYVRRYVKKERDHHEQLW